MIPPTPLTSRDSSLPVGFGIVGHGMIAGYHARAIAATPGARLVGVAGLRAEATQAFAREHGAGLATTSLDELLARPDLDAVCITTPSGAHLQPSLAAIRAGKHLVVEKPMEITTARVDELLAAAEQRRVLVAPIFQARFGEGAQRVKAAIEAGRLGRLVLASAYVKWHRTAAYYTGWKGTLALDGGGAVINQAIHGLDLLQWFAGMPTSVSARTARRVHTGIEAEDTAAAVFEFPGGALGTLEATTAAWPGWSRRIELCGETGSVVLEDDRITRWDFRQVEPGDEAVVLADTAAALGSGASNPSGISVAGHQRQISDLVDAIRTGKPLAIDGREARKAVALVNALYASAARGAAVAP